LKRRAACGDRQVFVCAELPDWIEVGGDQVRCFVLVTTTHSGTGAVRATVTPIRDACNNTLRAALERARSEYRSRTSATRRVSCTRPAACSA
jgi:Domain of unknown function (DUF932)